MGDGSGKDWRRRYSLVPADLPSRPGRRRGVFTSSPVPVPTQGRAGRALPLPVDSESRGAGSRGNLEARGDRARACCARFASCPAASFPAALYPAALFGAEWDFKLGFVDFVRQRPANWSLETAQRGGEQVRRRLARRRRGGQTVGIWPYVGAEPQRYESSE